MSITLAGPPGPRFEEALARALAARGFDAVARATHPSREAHWRWLGSRPGAAPPGPGSEPPSLLFFGQGREGSGPLATTLEVRGLRSPLWNLGLARDLSGAQGGLGLSYVCDRLQGEHGYGVFFAGHPVEVAARDVLRVTARAGFAAAVPDEAVFLALDEDRIASQHRALVAGCVDERRTDPSVRGWVLAPRAQPAAAEDVSPWNAWAVLAGGAIPQGPAVDAGDLGLPAGWQVRRAAAVPRHEPAGLPLDPETYLPVAPAARPYLALRTAAAAAAPAEVLRAGDALGAVAVLVRAPSAPAGPFEWWARRRDGSKESGRAMGAAALLCAWEPVFDELGTSVAELHWAGG